MITQLNYKGPDEELLEGDMPVSLPVLLWMNLLLMELLLWSCCCGPAEVDAGPVYSCKTVHHSAGWRPQRHAQQLQLEFQT